jgi:plasmid replication initiation protein
MKSNLQVSKDNKLVEASYSLPVQAQKLLLACLAKVDSRSEITKTMKITSVEFSELMGVPNAHRELYLAADSLFRSSIIITENNRKREICWIQEKIEKIAGAGEITLMWSDSVLPYISCLKGRFTTYKLKHIAKLQSAHSIRLYELLMRFKKIKERLIYIEDFKSTLGIADCYAEFKELNRRVIKPAIKELNEKTDLVVECETVKNGRSVVALSFSFKNKLPSL